MFLIESMEEIRRIDILFIDGRTGQEEAQEDMSNITWLLQNY